MIKNIRCLDKLDGKKTKMNGFENYVCCERHVLNLVWETST